MSRGRLLVVGLALAAGAVGVVLRLVQVMVVDHGEWAERARRQREQVISVPAPRGDILSSDGYLLATSVERLAIQLDTGRLSYPSLFVGATSPLLDVEPEPLLRRIVDGPRMVWLAREVDRELAARVHALAPEAIVLVPDAERVYPHGSLAAALVGFVGREELRIVGRSGFEHHYDAMLSGEPETWLAFGDAVRRRLRLERLRPGRAGYDLRLTVVARLQARAEEALQDAIDATGAAAGSVVVMDARDGAVLAAASLPSFDPARGGEAPPASWRLRAVQDALEPGSTVKPLVAAAALADGVVRRGERFDCTRRGVRVAGRWLRDHVEPGRYTLEEIIVYSANAGIVEVARRLEPSALWGALDAFGFGARTGAGFPAEAAGLLPGPDRWSALSAASLALGQELIVSPLQLAAAYGAIANGGWLMRPRFVSSARSADGEAAGTGEVRRRVLDKALAERLQRALERTVAEGTGAEAGVPGMRVAGKTGTAQRAVDGDYEDGRHVAWFAGFMPMPAPWLVVVVAVEDPKEDFWASTVAAPVFSRIAGDAAVLLRIPPSATSPDAPRAASVRAGADPPAAGGAA